jgi:hypothetical protein
MRTRAAVVAAAVGALSFVGITTASAQTGERITSYTVLLAIQSDGALHIREEIAYDFGAARHHGIERFILVKTPYDQRNDTLRVFPVSNVTVGTPDGSATPVELATSKSGNTETLRIGDPNRTITGLHHYVISYDVRGAMQSFADHDELYWNAIGPAWPVPIDSATVTVRGPAAVTRATCFVGAVGSRLPCASTSYDNRPPPRAVVYRATSMASGDVFTVVAALPPGTVPHAVPILEHRRTLASAFSVTPATLGVTGAVLAALLAWLAWVWWANGRDRRYIDQIPGLVPAAGQQVADEPTPLLGHTVTSVEFAPPDNVRPGEVGTLLDEQANTLDVTASIVDLAVRGYLRIEEVSEQHWYGGGDWKLTRSDKAADDLNEYERTLLAALFVSGDTVLISELKGTFASSLSKVRNQLYNDVVAKGWFARRPDIVRSQWLGVALAVLAAGAVSTWLLATNTRFGLVGLAVLFAGIVVLLFHNAMPARTARGSAMLARVEGFRRYLVTAEAAQLKFEEKADVFARYLPFAIVFGVTEKWAHAFERLAAAQPSAATGAMSWYAGPPGWDIAFLAASLSSFSLATSGVIASQPVSTSGLGGGFGTGFGGGGFGGGGGGGGGGGSW